MFFWIQNGLMTPRTPAVLTPTVTRITGTLAGNAPHAFEPEEDIFGAGKGGHLHPNPKQAYEIASVVEEESSPLLFASQVMSKPVFTLSEFSSIEEARDAFLVKRYRHIPIVDSKKRLVGILSDRDFWKQFYEDQDNRKKNISYYMIEKVLTGSMQTEIRYAAKVMLDEKVGSLPIISEANLILGIITRTDLMRAIVKFPGFTLLA